MKRRMFIWIALAALALRLVAPLAAYESAMAVPGFNEVCSAAAKTSPAGAPEAPPQRHLVSCCADCPFGGGVAMLPSAIVLPQFLAGHFLHVAITPRAVAATAPGLLPPPRGPPASLASA